MQIDVIEATWGRVLRVCWSWAWRCAVTAVLLGLLFDLARSAPLPVASNAAPTRVGSAPMDNALHLLALLILTVVPFRLILGKDFGDFRLALVREPPDADVAVFAKSRWSRGLGPVLGAAILGTAVVREYWRRAPQDLLLILGVLAGIAVTTQGVRWFLLSRAARHVDRAPQ